MKKNIKSLYKSLEKMTKEELLAVLKIRYNTNGLKNIVAYFILETLDEEDANEIADVKNLFKVANKFKI